MTDASMISAVHRPSSWPLSSFLELRAWPTAAPCARLHAKLVLNEWGVAHLGDTVELLVSELMTNAIQASQRMPGPSTPPVRLRLSSDRAVVLIEVWDGNPGAPVLMDADENAESGRGLILVDALSTRWSWYLPPERDGKVVWAEVGP
jgi:anti-sigma regulatory factor (Ser/Thr protein kinase)